MISELHLNGIFDPEFQRVLFQSLEVQQPAQGPPREAAARVNRHAQAALGAANPGPRRVNPPSVVNNAVPAGGLNAEGLPNVIRAPRPHEVPVQGVANKPWLLNNPLSWLWTPQGRQAVGSGFYCLFPFTYVLGCAGYALSLPTRVVECAVKLIKLIGTFLAFAFTCGYAVRWKDVKKRAIVSLGSFGSVLSAAIGCACPIAAYRLDEAIESNKYIHRYSMNIWNHEFLSPHKAIKIQYQEFADEIENADETFEEIWTDWGTLMPNELQNKVALAFAAMFLKGLAEKLPRMDRGPTAEMLESLKDQFSTQTLLDYLALHLAGADLKPEYARNLEAAKADLAAKGLTDTFSQFQKSLTDLEQFFASNLREVHSALVNNTI